MILKDVLRPVKTAIRPAYWKLVRSTKGVPPVVNAKGRTLLHLGCGPINAQGYINIDAQPFPHIHHVKNVYPLDFIEPNSVDLIYASHVLEHFSHIETSDILKDWRRALKKGGVLRLGVPNLKVILQIYSDTGEIDDILGPLMGGQSNPYNFHYTAFDRPFMAKQMRAAGFDDIRDWNPEQVEDHPFKDTTSNIWRIAGKDYPISLNIEAIK